MNDRDKLRFLVAQIVPPRKTDFWNWFENKFMKYGGSADTVDMTTLGESLRVAQAELANDSHEKLLKDAERYRWLREKSTEHSGDIQLSIWIGGENGDWEWPKTADEVDEVIDAAMQETTNA